MTIKTQVEEIPCAPWECRHSSREERWKWHKIWHERDKIESYSLSLCHLLDVSFPCHLLKEALIELRTPSSEKGLGNSIHSSGALPWLVNCQETQESRGGALASWEPELLNVNPATLCFLSNWCHWTTRWINVILSPIPTPTTRLICNCFWRPLLLNQLHIFGGGREGILRKLM